MTGNLRAGRAVALLAAGAVAEYFFDRDHGRRRRHLARDRSLAVLRRGSREIRPVKPNTIAKSLAIGNPADGYYAATLIPESGGWADDCTDHEIVAGIQLLAETEGIFTETAGGVAVAVAQKLVQQGRIKQADLTVIAITGNGLKTLEALDMAPPQVIEPKLAAFEQAFRGAYHVA